jgi:hypothetical protein
MECKVKIGYANMSGAALLEEMKKKRIPTT